MAIRNCSFTLVSLYFLIGCGGGYERKVPAQQINAAEVFSSAMIGQTWTFENHHGDITTVEVLAAPVTNYVPTACVIWHFRKNNPRAYWSPGNAGAENLQVLCMAEDGSWNSIMNDSIFPDGQAPGTVPFVATQEVQPTESGKLPYILIPASTDAGVVATAYANYIDLTQLRFDSIIEPPHRSPGYPTVPWTTSAYLANVDTPLYKGPALVSEQHEGLFHERWYFAPGLGLVEIQPLVGGPGTVDSENLTIKRTH